MAGGVLRVRSSCSMRSSLLSTSSRRRRIKERLVWAVMTSQHRSKRPRQEGDGGHASRGHLGRADRKRRTQSSPLALLVAQTTSRDLFICAKYLFVEATAGPS